MSPMNSHKALIIFLLLVISGCSKQGLIKENRDWNQIHSWSFKGKMSLKSDIESGSGRIIWQNTNGKIQARFTAPLGQGSWQINELEDRTELISSQNGTSYADTTENLLEYELGWPFPWTQLSKWLRGFHSDENIQAHEQTRESIEEKGWLIEYSQWINTSFGWLPKKIKASKPPYQIRLVIYSWDIN